MMDPARPPVSAEAKFQSSLADTLPRKIKRSNSFTTTTTSATEESSCCGESQSGGAHKPKNVPSPKVASPMTPGRQTKYMMTLSKNTKNHSLMKALPTLAIADEQPSTEKPADLNDSFESNEDHEWWNQESPQSTSEKNMPKPIPSKPQTLPDMILPNERQVKTKGTVSTADSQKPILSKPPALSDIILDEKRVKTEGSVSTTDSGKRKKKITKVKRISVTKVKAGDLGSMTTPKFRKKNGQPLTEEEMQEALKAWKNEQLREHPLMSSSSGSKDRRPKSASRPRSDDEEALPTTSSSSRSKSTSRSRTSDEVSVPSSIPSDILRPKSASRRRSTDHCAISMTPAGVSGIDPRWTKSASRRRPHGGDPEGSRTRSRGDERADSDRQRSRSVGRRDRDDDPSRRSRSVARKREGEEGEGKTAPLRHRSKSLSHKKRPEDGGERDRRSRSRGRPTASEGEKPKRPKSVSRAQGGGRTEQKIEGEQTRRSTERGPETRSRSKSLGRTHSLDGDEDDRRKFKRATNIKDRRSSSRNRARGLSFSKEDEFQKLANHSCGENSFPFASEEFFTNTDDRPKKTAPQSPASKNIPWSEFLLHSAAFSRSLGARDK